MGSVDVYDSRFSSVDYENNWSLGLVVKKWENIRVAFMGNAKTEVGFGASLHFPVASIHFGTLTKLCECKSRNDDFSFNYSVAI